MTVGICLLYIHFYSFIHVYIYIYLKVNEVVSVSLRLILIEKLPITHLPIISFFYFFVLFFPLFVSSIYYFSCYITEGLNVYQLVMLSLSQFYPIPEGNVMINIYGIVEDDPFYLRDFPFFFFFFFPNFFRGLNG